MKRRNGFTLVETLVVVAIFAVIGVSLISSFSMGLKVWKSSAKKNILSRRVIINLERLSRDLRQSIDHPAIGFFGDKNFIEFASLSQGKILNVSYFYLPQEKTVFRSAVIRQSMLEPENQTTPRRIITGAEDLEFSYSYFDVNSSEYTFADSWNYTSQGVPLAVKVRLTLEDEKVFEKIVYLPFTQ